MKVLIVSDSHLPVSGDLRTAAPAEVMSAVPQETYVLVDTRDLAGQTAALIKHLASGGYNGLLVLMNSFVHVPICVGGCFDPFPEADQEEVARTARALIEDVIPAYVSATGRPFEKPPLPSFVGISPVVDDIRALFSRIAQQDRSTVLLNGASGTGKQIVARGIHESSPRGSRPFVEINCATLPDTLLENELFGRERGAYTDAHTTRQGLIEMASDGTLFLDEIGNITERLQMALLKVIEQKTYRRVGGDDERTSEARFVAATSTDLEQAMEAGSFRSDLFYRLNVFTISLPELKQRDADAVLLAQYFAQNFAEEYERPFAGLTSGVATRLLKHDWPGNVRELKNVIERAVVLSDDRWLGVSPVRLGNGSVEEEKATGTEPAFSVDHTGAIHVSIPPWGISLNAIEKAVIQAALEATSNNITRTAKLLFLSRDTVRYRMKKYGLNGSDDG